MGAKKPTPPPEETPEQRAERHAMQDKYLKYLKIMKQKRE